MPGRERVQAFVAMVEAGDYVEAIRQFYTDDATMQENLGTIRTGRDTLVAARGDRAEDGESDHDTAGHGLRGRRRSRGR